MDGMNYQKVAEVSGRWKAEIIQSFLNAAGIDVELIQESVIHSAYPSSFDAVQIFIHKKNVQRARELLKSFDEFQQEEYDDEEE